KDDVYLAYTIDASPRRRAIRGGDHAGADLSPTRESTCGRVAPACVRAGRLRARHSATGDRTVGSDAALPIGGAERRGQTGSARGAGAAPVPVRGEPRPGTG